jgi:trigger factor
MQITKQNIDNLTSTLKLTISKEDYAPKVEKTLKDYIKKATIPGFRPGMAPMGLIKKTHGKHVLLDEINKIISDSLTNYISENKLHVLGDPLPNETEQKEIDWENPSEMEFFFDIAEAPAVNVDLTKKMSLKQYNIIVDDKMLESYIENFSNRYGSYKPGKKVKSDELLKGDFIELNSKGEALENGINIDDVSISLAVIKDEDSKKKFDGAKVDDVIVFNPKIAFPNDTDRAAMLNVSKEEVAKIESDFSFTIKDIKTYESAKLDQDLFDKVLGKDVAKTEEEFKSKVRDDIRTNLMFETDYKLKLDSREHLLDTVKIEIPVEFLKRWLLYTNTSKLSAEEIERDFPLFEQDLKWQLIKDTILKDNDVKIENEEIVNMAKEVARMQFKQYGINFVENEHLETYAQQILKNEDERKKLIERLIEDKIVGVIKEKVKIDEKEITAEEFNKLFDTK